MKKEKPAEKYRNYFKSSRRDTIIVNCQLLIVNLLNSVFPSAAGIYSHSTVAGGLLVMS